MLRLLFEKRGKSVWISHLDLMRLFQRAFKRAGLQLTHTKGFNPRPSVSIALPLSVGIESQCELLDFELETYDLSLDQMQAKLNSNLTDGIRVLQIYSGGGKIGDIAYLRCKLSLEYDSAIPCGSIDALRDLFDTGELIVQKKTKNGIQEQNIVPMIKEISFKTENDCTIGCECVICCQNPTLNPNQIQGAISAYRPALKPDFCRILRQEIYDHNFEVFR